MGSQVWGARYLVSELMDLFGTTVQVHGRTVHLTLILRYAAIHALFGPRVLHDASTKQGH
jgi:hypothetical protein